VPSGRRLGSIASRLLRYLLPFCLVAATVVAGMGLLRVIGRSSEPTPSQTAVALTLGGPAQSVPSRFPATPFPAAVSASPSASPTPRPVPVTSSVAVLNASTIRGLATRAAALLREKGVTVAAIANLSGTQKPTEGTVFYAPGLEAQARALAGLLGGPAVAPAPDWIPADGKLVLVVTDSGISAPIPTS
jgi:hypothetical protein